MTQVLRRILFSAVVIASIWGATATSAGAQESTKPKTGSAKADVKVSVRDSVSLEEVQKAAEQLAVAVESAVRKATEDPAVKVAALKVAKNAVTAAQVAITLQAETLQTVLDTLAKEIALATEKQKAKAEKP